MGSEEDKGISCDDGESDCGSAIKSEEDAIEEEDETEEEEEEEDEAEERFL